MNIIIKKKFILEFDHEPSLLFVQFEAGNNFEVYQDGLPVKGIRSVTINASYDDVTTHEIQYVTGATKTNKADIGFVNKSR